jgi:NADPH:quinone reductase
MSFATVWLGLVNYARVERGDYVIINTASSSVGLSAIQVVRRSRGVPIALTRTPAKVQALKEAGASHVIVTEKEDVPQAVLKLADYRGPRVVFDAAGGKTFSSLVAAAAPETVILVYGVLG